MFRGKGDFLFGSTINQHNLMYMKVTSVGSESALAQIVHLVEAAQMNKAPVQAYADQIAGVFTPTVLFLASATFIVWASLSLCHIVPNEWFDEEYGSPWLFALLFGISVVVISCPCALGLATPTAIMVGTSVGAVNGILIKGGPAFETAHGVKTVIFDKTGTLTEGHPTVTDEITFDSPLDPSPKLSKDFVLRLAASAEIGSEHPLASAVMRAAQTRNLNLSPIVENSFNAVPGSGLSCQLHEGTVLVGNRGFMDSNSIFLGSIIDNAMWDMEVQGKTVVCIALNGKVVGVIGIADVAKKEAFSTIAVLRSMGIDVWMVTGDNRTTAEAIADELDIPKDRVVAGVMPADKVAKVAELQSLGQVVAMVGDGINDSPALAKADLGIAVGAGTHVAIEAADVVLIRNNLHDVVVALDLARRVFNRIKWNFMWACIYNIVAIPFAAGIWFPWTHMLVPPQYAGLSMAMSSISVFISSMLLKFYRRPDFSVGDNKKPFGRKVLEEAARFAFVNHFSVFLHLNCRGLTTLRNSIKDRVKIAGGRSKGPRYTKLPMEDRDDDTKTLGIELGLGTFRSYSSPSPTTHESLNPLIGVDDDIV